MSPDPAAGKRFRRPLMPWTAMTNKFLAPRKHKTRIEKHKKKKNRSSNEKLVFRAYQCCPRSWWQHPRANRAICETWLRRNHHVLNDREKSTFIVYIVKTRTRNERNNGVVDANPFWRAERFEFSFSDRNRMKINNIIDLPLLDIVACYSYVRKGKWTIERDSNGTAHEIT